MQLHMHRARDAEHEHGAGSRASPQRWRTVVAGCTAAHLTARLKAIRTPSSTDFARLKQSPVDVKNSSPGVRRKGRSLRLPLSQCPLLDGLDRKLPADAQKGASGPGTDIA
jgi:hypothetical protein